MDEKYSKFIKNDELFNINNLSVEEFDELMSISDKLIDKCLVFSSSNVLNFILDEVTDLSEFNDSKIIEWFHNSPNLDCLEIIIDKDIDCNNILSKYFISNNYSREILHCMNNEMIDYILTIFPNFNLILI